MSAIWLPFEPTAVLSVGVGSPAVTERAEFTAELVSAGASGFAMSSARLLLERRPELAERFGRTAFRHWSRHLVQRCRELSAALLVDEPELFAAELAWSRTGFERREVPVDDLSASLECLAETLSNELPEDSVEPLATYFELAVERLAQAPEGGPDAIHGVENRLVLEYLEAAISGRQRRAIGLVVDAVDNGLQIEEAYRDVLEVAQRLVGEMWHAQELSVAQEHFVTATTEAVMTLLAHRAEPPAPAERTVVVAVVPGNAHQLGARALAHWFEMDGWNAIYLGSELPATEAAAALEVFEADLFALSIALSVQIPAARSAVRAAREARPECRILLGGRVIASVSDLWRKLGADATAGSAKEAIAVAHQLLDS